ncbi:MAG TPA: iron-containing alcohol dehydrogenase [Chloroflexota bacterium]|nr:iron-containing alcohol dehydrogenase [Chloroflexota bacterium]
MRPFTFDIPTRVTFGAGAVESIGAAVAAEGAKALVVTGATFARRSGLINTIRSALEDAGVGVAVFDGVEPNPRAAAIDRGGDVARDVGADVILGLGGGSALDAAKAIAVAAADAMPIWEHVAYGRPRPAPITAALPVIQVPIVASTGSEVNDQAVLFNAEQRVKAPIRSPHMQARSAIIDPTLTFTVPPRFTAVGGMNIVSQMLESYLTSDEFVVTDRIAEGLMRGVFDSLPRALRRGEDLEARTNLSWSAVMAVTAATAGRASTAPLRSMAMPINAFYSVDHGFAVSALWPSFMRYSLNQRRRLPAVARFKRYALLGRQIFGVHETDDEVAAEMTSYRFANWLRNMNMPTSLTQLDIAGIDTAALAQQAVDVWGNGRKLPSGLTVEDIEHIYEGAMRPD